MKNKILEELEVPEFIPIPLGWADFEDLQAQLEQYELRVQVEDSDYKDVVLTKSNYSLYCSGFDKNLYVNYIEKVSEF